MLDALFFDSCHSRLDFALLPPRFALQISLYSGKTTTSLMYFQIVPFDLLVMTLISCRLLPILLKFIISFTSFADNAGLGM